MRNEKGQFIKGSLVKDLVGQTFNYLTVVEFSHTTNNGKSRYTFWKCICSCGNEKVVRGDHLKSGNTKSCGCHKKKVDSEKALKLKEVNRKHGKANTSLYNKWRAMVDRCYNIENKRFHDYGEIGIKVCKEWLEFETFEKWALSNGYKENLEIDRINNNDNYEPSNCRYITRKENCNNRRSCIYIEFNGVTKTLMQWSEFLNVNYKMLYERVKKSNNPTEVIKKIYDNSEVTL